jgi:hypothetical protein
MLPGAELEDRSDSQILSDKNRGCLMLSELKGVKTVTMN